MQQARLKNLLPGAFWVFAGTGAVLSVAGAYGYLVGGSVLTGTSSSPGDPVLGRDVHDRHRPAGPGHPGRRAGGAGPQRPQEGELAARPQRGLGRDRLLAAVGAPLRAAAVRAGGRAGAGAADLLAPRPARTRCWTSRPGETETGDGDGGYAGDPTLQRADGGQLVLAGHSQGSLVSLVALLWLPPEARERVRWLTFGSQLRQQFPRAFPHYVTVPLLQDAATHHRWLSLYRDTDPAAGPVTSWDHTPDGSAELDVGAAHAAAGRPEPDRVDPRTGRRECGDEWRLLDPAPSDVALQTGAVATIRGHGGYWCSPDWTDAVARLLEPAEQPGGASVPDQQRDREPASSSPSRTPSASETTRAGQQVAPRSGGQRQGGVAPAAGAPGRAGSRVATVTAPPRSKATTCSAAGPVAATGS